MAKRQRASGWLCSGLAMLMLLGLYYSQSPNFRWSENRRSGPFGGDFLQEWIGGYAIRSGNMHRLYELDYIQELQHDATVVGFEWDPTKYFPMVYPPFYYLVATPLAGVPLRAAAIVWAVLMCVSLGAGLWLLVRELGAPGGWARHATLPRDRLPLVVPLLLAFPPLVENLLSNQKGTVGLLLLTSTFVLLNRGRRYAGGLVFGLLAFKPQLTLVIGFAFLWKRQWRFLAGALTTVCVLVAICLAMGSKLCAEYIRFSLSAADYVMTPGYALTKSHCLQGFFALLLGHTTLARVSTLAATLVAITLLGRNLSGVLVTNTPRFAQQFSAMVLGTTLLSPHLFTYDLTILLLPLTVLVWLLFDRRHEKRTSLMLGGLLFLFAGVGVSEISAAWWGVQWTVPVVFFLLATLSCETNEQSSAAGHAPGRITCPRAPGESAAGRSCSTAFTLAARDRFRCCRALATQPTSVCSANG